MALATPSRNGTDSILLHVPDHPLLYFHLAKRLRIPKRAAEVEAAEAAAAAVTPKSPIEELRRCWLGLRLPLANTAFCRRWQSICSSISI